MPTIENFEHLLSIDQNSIWHPYSAMQSDLPIYHVVSAEGVRLKLSNGQQLIDGMSSWWSAIHGYNNPEINSALQRQLKDMAHVMFGGFTHTPAIKLTEKLLSIVPNTLEAVFYSDSGSVAVEVAMKMAIQYWHAKGQVQRQRFISLRSGYHGDTFGAMSVCDPVTGMHSLFSESIPKQFFVEQPKCRFGGPCSEKHITEIKQVLEKNSKNIAAFILEPIVQGAGGMWFYSADYLKEIHQLCREYNVLLIFDEIATGFGRTGKLFACEHTKVTPDIMCIGKALTGGYLSLAATITTKDIHETIDNGEPGVFMHGPTFMGNPLSCSAANASIEILLNSDWKKRILQIQSLLNSQLLPLRGEQNVVDIRVIGAIGVIEFEKPLDMKSTQERLINDGVWLRPYGKLLYTMPPYIISDKELTTITQAMIRVADQD